MPATCAARRTQPGHLQLQERSTKLCRMTPVCLQASEAHGTAAVGIQPADTCPEPASAIWRSCVLLAGTKSVPSCCWLANMKLYEETNLADT